MTMAIFDKLFIIKVTTSSLSVACWVIWPKKSDSGGCHSLT